MGAEAGGVDERGTLGDAAAVAHRLEVTDVSAGVPLVTGVGHEARRCRARPATRPASRSRSRCSPTRSRRVHEVLERHVDGEVLVAGRRERRDAPLVVAVGAQPAGSPRADELRPGRRRSRSTTSRPRRNATAHARSQLDERRRHGDACTVGRVRRPRGRPRPRARPPRARALSTSASPSTATRTSHQVPSRRSTIRNGRLSSSSLASTTPSSGTAGRSSSAVTMGPMPATGQRRVLVVAHHRSERVLERLDGEQVPLCGTQRRRALDQHVAQRASRTRARRRARPARAGRVRRPPRSRGTDRAHRRHATIRRARGRRAHRRAARPRGW